MCWFISVYESDRKNRQGRQCVSVYLCGTEASIPDLKVHFRACHLLTWASMLSHHWGILYQWHHRYWTDREGKDAHRVSGNKRKDTLKGHQGCFLFRSSTVKTHHLCFLILSWGLSGQEDECRSPQCYSKATDCENNYPHMLEFFNWGSRCRCFVQVWLLSQAVACIHPQATPSRIVHLNLQINYSISVIVNHCYRLNDSFFLSEEKWRAVYVNMV